MLQDCSETMMVVCKIYEEGITKIMEPYVSKKESKLPNGLPITYKFGTI